MSVPTPILYWSVLETEDWRLHLAATEEGLCFVGAQGQPYTELTDWASARYPRHELARDDSRLQPYAAELAAFLLGKPEHFALPLACRGTSFQESVWQALRAIPYGETRSYSDIARAIGKPAAVRAVGAAIGANPVLIAIPCHRVVGKNGTLTGYRGGLDMKSRLLAMESGCPLTATVAASASVEIR